MSTSSILRAPLCVLALVGLLGAAGCTFVQEDSDGWQRARSETLFELPDGAVVGDDGRTVILPQARTSYRGSTYRGYNPPVVIERDASPRVYRPTIVRPYVGGGLVLRDYDDRYRAERAYREGRRDGRREAARGLETYRPEALRPRFERAERREARRDEGRRDRGGSGPCVFGLANDNCR